MTEQQQLSRRSPARRWIAAAILIAGIGSSWLAYSHHRGEAVANSAPPALPKVLVSKPLVRELDARVAKDTMDAAQKVYEGRQDLFEQGASSQKDVNDANVAFVTARSNYEVARKHADDLQSFARDAEIKAAVAQRDTAKAHEETAQTQLAYARITSPINGIVTDRPVFAGEMPQPGAPLITVMDTSQINAKTHLSPQDAAVLKVGDPANVLAPYPAATSGLVAGEWNRAAIANNRVEIRVH